VADSTWPTIEQVQNEIQSGESLHQKLTAKYDRAYEVYRGTAPTGRRRQAWESSLRVKYGMQVVDTAMVNIVGGVPRAKVRPRRPQDSETAPKMQTVLDYHVHEDHLVEKLPAFVQQALIYGVTAAKNRWLFEERDRPMRHMLPNPANPQVPLQLEGTERVTLRDGPTFEPWDIYDCWWEPNARDVDSAEYVALRTWMSKDQLEQYARSESNPYGLFDMAAVKKLLEEGPGEINRTSAQERLIGGTFDKRKDRFQVVEVWRDKTYSIVSSGKVVLNHEANPYWHGRKPVVITQVRPDLFEMQGISETELLDDIQEAIWTIQNMVIDNMKLTVQRGITYRESGILDDSVLDLKPRFKWPVTDHDDIQFQNPPPLPPEAYRERDVMKADMQLVTGINPYISGADSAGVDQNTATGVTALQEVASRLLRFKARMIAYKGIQRTFEQWGELVQQFMDHEQAIRIEGAAGYDWEHVTPQEVIGNYDYSVEGTEESLSRQQERSEMNQLLQSLAPFAQAPWMNWRSIAEKIGKAYDIEPSALFLQQPDQPPAAPNGQPPPNGQPQAEPQPMQGGGQQLPPQVQAMIQGGAQG
jgi:hypothetical protein